MNLKQKVFQNPAYFIAFGFGSGLMKFAPGTWGTGVGVLVYLLMAHLPWWLYAVLTVFAFILGVAVSHKVSREMGVHDYSGIVWDEVVGYLLTMFLVPFHVVWIAVGFLLFRLFDIWKPQPIRFVDKHVKGGLGIMLDDVLAAIPAAILLQLLVWMVNR